MRLICALLVFVLTGAAPVRGELTHGSALADIYDLILAGQFERAERDLAQACPPAPVEACQAMSVAILWWRISLNPDNQVFDAAIEREANAAIRAAEAWTRREPNRAEAWFYHAAAHAPLVQWRLLRGQRLTAVREASRVKDSLERALELDPGLQDAHFGIGVYRYYAAIAPAALRMLRWLLWLPGGDREEGLKQMEQARDGGQLLRGEIDYQLHFVYLWYEDQPERALELLEGLHQRYPSNPLFLERIAEVQRDYFNDHPASVEAWRELFARASRSGTAMPEVAATVAQLGLAETYERMSRTDRAIETLEALVMRNPTEPPTGLGRAHLQLGRAHDRMGERARALLAYRAAISRAPSGAQGEKIRNDASDGLDDAPGASETQAYRSSIEGIQALEAGDVARALNLLKQSVEVRPDDPVSRYRYARALSADNQRAQAVQHLEMVLRTVSSVPPFIRAAALIDLAAVRERDGDLTGAIDLFKRALGVRGSAPETRASAQQALRRLVP